MFLHVIARLVTIAIFLRVLLVRGRLVIACFRLSLVVLTEGTAGFPAGGLAELVQLSLGHIGQATTCCSGRFYIRADRPGHVWRQVAHHLSLLLLVVRVERNVALRRISIFLPSRHHGTIALLLRPAAAHE